VGAARPAAIDIAEYWGPEPAVVRPRWEGGAGFDASWHDGLRRAVRGVVAEAAGGRDAAVHWQPVVDQLRAPGFPDAWRAVQCLESHDEVYRDRAERIATLAGGGNPRTWYARSRSRVAMGLLLTAPGIPMLFMGQEFMEHRRWADAPEHHADTLIDWDRLATDKAASDFHRYTRELIWLRRRHPALRAGGIATIAMDDFRRVLAFQRWIPGAGRDVVVVASLNESTLSGIAIPFPAGGDWLEVCNSDVYENWVNPAAAGNGGRIRADGGPRSGLPASAMLTLPANGLLVFARDGGD
jgi:1,4-alpha-glucan branching enzyme